MPDRNHLPAQWDSGPLGPDLLRAALGAVEEGVVIHASSGEIVGTNVAACDILGLTNDQLRGRTSMDPAWRAVREDGSAFPGEEHPAMVTLATGAPVDGVVMGVDRPAGGRRWIRVASRAVDVGDDRFVIARFSDITSMRSMEGLLGHFAHQDLLTDVPNRIQFEQLLEAATGRADQTGDRCAVVVAGIDHFGATNEHLGTRAADDVLIECANRLQRMAGDGGAIGRVGDDQFALLAESCGTDEDVHSLADAVRHALGEPVAIGPEEHIPSITIGVALHPVEGDDDLLVSAIGALEAAKRSDRGSIRFFGGVDPRSRTTYRHDQGIRRAIARGDVRLWYQSIRDLEEEATIGIEALFRIEGPDAQETGQAVLTPEILGTLGPRIAGHVLDLLVEDAESMHAAGSLAPSVSVNLTAPDLVIPRIHAQVRRAGTLIQGLGSALVVEVSEQIGLEDPTEARAALDDLRAAGIRVALDDFGTGSNSLAVLRELPLDSLKLDASFVRGAMTNATDRAIIKASVALADELGLPVVAEGVETEEILAFVRAAGIRYAQGYLFEAPGPLGGAAG